MKRPPQKTVYAPRSKALLWFAFLSLATGFGIAYAISQQEANPNAFSQITLTLGIAITITGILIISHTANWWLKR